VEVEDKFFDVGGGGCSGGLEVVVWSHRGAALLVVAGLHRRCEEKIRRWVRYAWWRQNGGCFDGSLWIGKGELRGGQESWMDKKMYGLKKIRIYSFK
jgi:hypothetical protein